MANATLIKAIGDEIVDAQKRRDEIAARRITPHQWLGSKLTHEDEDLKVRIDVLTYAISIEGDEEDNAMFRSFVPPFMLARTTKGSHIHAVRVHVWIGRDDELRLAYYPNCRTTPKGMHSWHFFAVKNGTGKEINCPSCLAKREPEPGALFTIKWRLTNEVNLPEPRLGHFSTFAEALDFAIAKLSDLKRIGDNQAPLVGQFSIWDAAKPDVSQVAHFKNGIEQASREVSRLRDLDFWRKLIFIATIDTHGTDNAITAQIFELRGLLDEAAVKLDQIAEAFTVRHDQGGR